MKERKNNKIILKKKKETKKRDNNVFMRGWIHFDWGFSFVI